MLWFLTPKGMLFCQIYSLCVFSYLRGQWKETLEPEWLLFSQILNGEWWLNPASKMLLSLSKPKLILLYEAVKEEHSWWTGRIEIIYGVKTSRNGVSGYNLWVRAHVRGGKQAKNNSFPEKWHRSNWELSSLPPFSPRSCHWVKVIVGLGGTSCSLFGRLL